MNAAAAPQKKEQIKRPEKGVCRNECGDFLLLNKERNIALNAALQGGFSLLEVLVAFAIMSLSIGLLYQAMGSSARQTADVTARERAALLAESLLALHETVPAQGLTEGGESAGMAWQLRSAPFATPVSSANPAAPLLHELRITVRWGDGPPREMTLQTLRPEQRPQPGGLMR